MAKIAARTPKGMRDFLPAEMLKRDYVFNVFKNVFESFGFEPIYTPVMELRSTLLGGNYGAEAEKLIYHAQHTQGKEELSLRYDLTVPMSRFFAEHENALSLPFRRYHIAPVWRGDRPGRGRYREFFQCDADIVGIKGLSADAECLALAHSALYRLGFQDFTIKISNRKLLNGIGIYAGVPDAQLGGLYRSIDKTDKIGLEGVAEELRQNGIAPEVVRKMIDLLSIQEADNARQISRFQTELNGIEAAQEGLSELSELLNYAAAFGIPEQHLALDFTMVRGLGYYTGPILEIMITQPENLGSVGSGGRYDELIGLFRSQSLPTTGISFGFERLIDLMDQLNLYPAELNATVVQVLVAAFNAEMMPHAMQLSSELRGLGFKAELYHDERKSLGKQFGYAEGRGIPIVAILGPDEHAADTVTLRHLATRQEINSPRAALGDNLRELLA